MSKGSRQRPLGVDQKTFDDNWDRVFNRRKKTDAEKWDEQVVMKNEYYDQNIDTEDPGSDK